VLGVDPGAELGGEMYYTGPAASWFRLTADLQVVQSGYQKAGTVVVAGASAQLRF